MSASQVDEFAPRLSFFWNGHSNFFEEVAKYRAARRIWARLMREVIGADDPRSWAMRFHTQTAGSTLTAQQPLNNVVRTTLQAWQRSSAAPSLCTPTPSTRRSGLPTDESALLALRTQQVIAYETGVADTVDPLAGSYFVESLTDQLQAKAEALIDRIEALGGAVAAIEDGWMQAQIEDSAYREARRQSEGSSIVVGVNRFQETADERGAGAGDRPIAGGRPEEASRAVEIRPQRRDSPLRPRRGGSRGQIRLESAACDERGIGRGRHAGRGVRSASQRVRQPSPRLIGSAEATGYRLLDFQMTDTRTHFLIIGGGPAGTQAATTAASKGARVTLVEKDIVGGAAHLWDCIPSKTMAASALRHTSIRNAAKLGLHDGGGTG